MCFVALVLLAGNVHATPTERLEAKYLKNRVKLRMDEDWKVQTGNIAGAEATAFDDAAWTVTSVPHDMSITLVSTTNNDPGAIGWYRKHFTLPPGFAGKKVIVQFDGVYHDSKIYLNGTQVGSQRFGYVSFCCDLTPYLNDTGDNVLAVFVDNQTSRRSHFYSGTGIYRHVWLIATDMVHVKNWGTAVTTPKVAVAQSQIRVQTDVVNELATRQKRTVETTIYDEAGKALQTVATPIKLKANSTNTCVQTLSLSNCKLWSPSTPVRYYAYSRILNQTVPTDDYVTPFGIRELKYFGERGFHPEWRSHQVEGRMHPSHAGSGRGRRAGTSCGNESSRNCRLQDALPSGRRIIRKARSFMTLATDWACWSWMNGVTSGGRPTRVRTMRISTRSGKRTSPRSSNGTEIIPAL